MGSRGIERESVEVDMRVCEREEKDIEKLTAIFNLVWGKYGALSVIKEEELRDLEIFGGDIQVVRQICRHTGRHKC